MKKLVILFLTLAFFLFPLNSQSLDDFESVQEVLVPKEVFVGDRADLCYTFRSAVDFFASADKSRIKGDVLTLVFTEQTFSSVKDKCQIVNAVLMRNGLNYTLDITFIPWQTGSIDFPSLALDQMCSGDTSSENSFIVNPSPVVISSLAEKLNVSSLKPPVSPIQLPGTTYILWTLIIIFILFLFVLALVIIKFPLIKEKYRRFKELKAFKKNEKTTLKKLSKLIHSAVNDKDFAVSWQHIMRSYLSKRFGTTFENTAASKIAYLIRKITQDTLDTDEQILVEILSQMFIRTDYVRYAQGSIDSTLLPLEEHSANFLPMERETIIHSSIDLIASFEDNKEKEE